MSPDPIRVLILCTGNSARSILGEAAITQFGGGRFQGYSAGSTPTGTPNPFAIRHLDGLGIDTAFARSKSWDEFAAPEAPAMDLVITVCDNAAGETCPFWPGAPLRAHWGLPDPAGVDGSDEDKAAAFAATWDALAQRVAALIALPWDDLEALGRAAMQDKIKAIHEDAQ